MKTELLFQLFCPALPISIIINVAKARIMLHVSRKDAWEQILKLHVQQITEGTKTNISSIKETFPKIMEEILISDKYNENEDNDEVDLSDNEGDTF